MTNYKALFYDLIKDQYVLKDESSYSLQPFQWYQYFQENTWNIVHNLNTEIMIYQIFVNDKVVEPDSFVIVDSNHIRINFNKPLLGFVNFIFYIKINN